jgi:transketolase
MAYSSKHLESRQNKYFCILGDAEIQEGSIWEACYFAAHYHLNNLVAIVDCNQFGQSNTLGHDKAALESIKRKFEAFGWQS